MNTIKFLVVVSIVLLASDVIANQIIKVYGQVPITNEEIRQKCSYEMTKADQETKARGENNSMLEAMFPLDSRIDFCVNMITQGLNAQGIQIK